MCVKSSLVCRVLFLALLFCAAASAAVVAQKSSTRQKTAQTKKKIASKRKTPLRVSTIIQSAAAQDSVCDDFYQNYNSTEGNFDVCLPNPPQNKKLADFLKTKSDVLLTALGEVQTSQLMLDTPTNTYIVVWYDLPEIVTGAEKTGETLEKIGFDKLKLTTADVLSAEKQTLGKWFERPFGCVDAPGDAFTICIKERFFISGKRLYRVAATSQTSSKKITKTIIENGFNRFLESFRIFNPKSN